MPICLRALEEADRKADLLESTRRTSEVEMRYQTLKLTKFYNEPEVKQLRQGSSLSVVGSASSIRSSNSSSDRSLLGTESGGSAGWFRWSRTNSNLSKNSWNSINQSDDASRQDRRCFHWSTSQQDLREAIQFSVSRSLKSTSETTIIFLTVNTVKSRKSRLSIHGKGRPPSHYLSWLVRHRHTIQQSNLGCNEAA